jgi:predicted phage-related endonuclease
MLTAQQLVARRSFIGASDVPSIMLPAEHAYASPLEVWGRKLGLLPDMAETPEMRIGTLKEPMVEQLFREETGLALTRCQETRYHPTIDWAACTPDCLLSEDLGGAPVQLKSVGEHAKDLRDYGPSGTDEVPAKHLIQVTWEMACLAVDEGFLAVLIGSSDFRWYHLPLSASLLEKCVAVCSDFWELVRTRTRPEPSWEHPRTPEIIAQLCRPVVAMSVALEPAWVEVADRYQQLGELIRTGEAEKEILRAKLQHRLGDATTGTLPDGREVRRKEISRKEYTVKASTYQTLTIK